MCFTCTLHVFYMRFTCTLHALYIHFTCALHALYMHFAVEPIDPRNYTARLVMHKPHKYLERFISHWCENSPCVESLSIPDEEMPKWNKEDEDSNGKKVVKTKLAQHRFLPCLCRVWANKSLDFCISQNKWPVLLTLPSGEEADMVKPFTIAFWVCYCNYMGGPGLLSDSCQKVLKYLLINPPKVVAGNSHLIYMQVTCNPHVICI